VTTSPSRTENPADHTANAIPYHEKN
jgi:hypothetical protein